MKKRLLVSVVILLLIVVGWKMYSDQSSDVKSLYEDSLSTARDKAELGIYEDAREAYLQAIEVSDTAELRKEYIDFLLKYDRSREALYAMQEFVTAYPHEALAYETACTYMIENKKRDDFYKYLEQAKKYSELTPALKALEDAHRYDYELNGELYKELRPFGGGMAAVQSEEGLWGYIDDSGKVAAQAIFSRAGVFTTDYAPVTEAGGETYIINKAGNKKFVDREHKTYDDFTAIAGSTFVISEGGQYRYVNLDFKTLVEGKTYQYASVINGARAAVKTGNNWQIIDDKQNVVGDKTFEDFMLDDKGVAFRGNRAFVKANGAYILIDESGNKVGDGQFEDAVLFAGDKLAAVKKNGKWGFVDMSGAMVIEPQFDDARSFVSGMAAVKKGELWGFIDSDGKMVIEPQFLAAYEISDNGTIPVQTEKGWRLLTVYSYYYGGK